ncbi:MAG TPA: CBS domain-containing protein [Bryobacteraceae bacterium]|jgi:signal-transduction protein with cAMP-binding, CBS, and nucleotidyltransferase domain
MRAATALRESTIRFEDPVRSLLTKKRSGNVWSIGPEASVYQAIEMMSEKQVGALIVTSAGRLLGIVSERDYARKVILKGRHSQETKVREIMTAPVLFVTPEKSLDDCMRLMTSRRVRHLPVLEGDGVVGIISIGDVVDWMIASQEQTIHHLQNYIAGAYPG